MELTKINELMANRGYSNAVGTIFSKWEFVKDEILLPSRKAGSGNGTVHVYLLEDNMPLFRECFPNYIQAVNNKCDNAENLCPRIKHFVLTSNIMTVAGFAYHHYNCDANVFNYSDFIGKVIRHDDNGMMTFDSLFKLSTENRPYFKQFDKQIFGKIIRYIFVPRKTAYKLYLYSDEEHQNFAAFWVFGQTPDKSFIIEGEHSGSKYVYDNNENEPTFVKEDEVEYNSASNIIEPNQENVEERFKNYMRSLGKSERTVNSYAANIRNLVPRAQKMIDGKVHPSPYTITDYAQLQELDKMLWSNPEIVEWNRNDHNRCSAALHMYMDMFANNFNGKKGNIDDSIEETCFPNNVDESAPINYTLSEEDEKRKESFGEYMRNTKGMSNITLNSYTGALQKRLSNLIRNYYIPNFCNIFAVSNYKELLSLENNIWDIAEIVEANEKSKGRLSAAFHAYTGYIESLLSDEELAEMVFGDSPISDNEDSPKPEESQYESTEDNLGNSIYTADSLDVSEVVLIKGSKGSSFVFNVMKYFEEQYGLESIIPYLSKNILWGIKKEGVFSMPGFFLNGSKEELNKRNTANVTSNGLALKRWYEEPFHVGEDIVYLTNQWHDDDKPGLSINNFEKMIQICFDEDYYIERSLSNEYILKVR